MSQELSLSNPTNMDDRPLPLIVAEKWGFPLTHEFENETYWFSIRDWVSGTTGAKDPKRQWQSLNSYTLSIPTFAGLC